MDKEKNFEFFVNTIKTLAFSQALYSPCFGRILRRVNEMDAGEIERLKNTLPQFKDSLDVIFYCEC